MKKRGERNDTRGSSRKKITKIGLDADFYSFYQKDLPKTTRNK